MQRAIRECLYVTRRIICWTSSSKLPIEAWIFPSNLISEVYQTWVPTSHWVLLPGLCSRVARYEDLDGRTERGEWGAACLWAYIWCWPETARKKTLRLEATRPQPCGMRGKYLHQFSSSISFTHRQLSG